MIKKSAKFENLYVTIPNPSWKENPNVLTEEQELVLEKQQIVFKVFTRYMRYEVALEGVDRKQMFEAIGKKWQEYNADKEKMKWFMDKFNKNEYTNHYASIKCKYD